MTIILFMIEELYIKDYTYHLWLVKGGVRLDPCKLSRKRNHILEQIQMYGRKEIFNSKFKENVTSPGRSI